MPRSYSIQKLFGDGGSFQDPVTLNWRILKKGGRPLLLLPDEASAAKHGLKLYAAQRPVAKLGRSVLSRGMSAPLLKVLPTFSLEADRSCDLVCFLREQAGLSVGQVPIPTVLFSSRTQGKERFILLLWNSRHEHFRVIKVGLPPYASVQVDREAELISKLPSDSASSIELLGRMTNGGLSAFSMPFYEGENPVSDSGVDTVLCSWIDRDVTLELNQLRPWRELSSAAGQIPEFQTIQSRIGGERIRAALFHGDFTPWNIRINRSGEWKVFDWERGELEGVPGWDWFHFVVQQAVLVKREKPDRVAENLERLLKSRRFNTYAAAAGISRISRDLVLAYLLRQEFVIKPEQGAITTKALFRLLVQKWEANKTFSITHPDTSNEQLPLEGNGNRPPVKKWRSAKRPYKSMQKSFFQVCQNLFRWLLANRADSTADPGTFSGRLSQNWQTVVFSWVLLVGAAIMHWFASPQMVFTPFYIVPCGLLTLTINRRWGFAAALAAAFLGPVVQKIAHPEYGALGILFWNASMRFLVYLGFVLLLDRVRPEILRFGNVHGPQENRA